VIQYEQGGSVLNEQKWISFDERSGSLLC